MVTVKYRERGVEIEVLMMARVWVNKVRPTLKEREINGVAVVSVEEGTPGEIEDAEAMMELRELLPKLRKAMKDVKE